MNTFYEFLQWKERDDILNEEAQHKNGTYVSVKLDKDSTEKLDTWVSNNNIPNQSDPNEYHATVIYSRKGVPEAQTYDLGLPIQAKVSGWSIFDTQQGTKCLVAKIDSKALMNHHEHLIQKFGATHDYPSYQPHVTVSYDYGSDEAPNEVPNFTLNFNSSEFKPLDPHFSPPKKNKT